VSRLEIWICTIVGVVLAAFMNNAIEHNIVFAVGAGTALALHWWFNRSNTE
jgi:hypothetical protein